MKNILIDLYYGHIYPYESIVPRDPAYRRTWRRVLNLEQSLLSGLTPDQQKLYEEITKEQAVPIEMEREETFAEGFRLGACMMAEAFRER